MSGIREIQSTTIREFFVYLARNPKIRLHFLAADPILVKSMVVTDQMMFVAGPPDLVKAKSGFGNDALKLSNSEEVLDAWNGKKGGRLMAVSSADGSKLGEIEIDSPPIFDGMAAAAGRLYMATADGKVICYADR